MRVLDRATNARRIRFGLVVGVTLALAALGATTLRAASMRERRLDRAHEETVRALEAFDGLVASSLSPRAESARLEAVRARVHAARTLGPSEEDEALLAGLHASLDSVAVDAREIAALDSEARAARSEIADLASTTRAVAELDGELERFKLPPQIDRLPLPESFDLLQREIEKTIEDLDRTVPRVTVVIGEDADEPAPPRLPPSNGPAIERN